MELPKNLIGRIEEKNAIEGVRNLVIANKIESGLIQHNKPGGRGQIAIVKDGIAWIERVYKLK